MSTIVYPTNSAYYLTPQTSWHIGIFVNRPIPPDGGDTLYTIQPHQKNRPDKLSFELYGTPSLWWIFSERNPFLRANPVWDFLPGLTIAVPSVAYLQGVLGV
jgi:hypothetical protein